MVRQVGRAATCHILSAGKEVPNTMANTSVGQGSMSDILNIEAPHQFERHTHNTRSKWQSIRRGLMLRCPACGEGKMFGKFLKVNNTCPHCGEELFHHQADDAPPYFTILLVGHLVVPPMLAVEMEYLPPIWFHLTVWPALIIVLSLAMLPRIKGAVVGLQWAARMHGFGDETAN